MEALKLAVIGCGAIGSRHIQALNMVSQPADLWVVDTDPQTLQQVKAALPQAGSSTVTTAKSLSELPSKLDLAVIATSSGPRLSIMRTLLSQVETKYLILEKVLFQSIDEYQEAQKLLDANRTQAWVNCPRRQMAFFQSIKEHFPSSDTIEYNVSGTEWGLACNAIHFIDNLAMYSGCLDYDMDISELEEYSHASKRDGYIEFYGTLKGEFQNGHRFILTCTKGNNVSLVTSISNANTSIRYESGAHTAQLTTGNVNQEIEHELTPQSQLTDKIAMQILATGASELPEFSESTKLHLPLINAFLAHINQSSSQIHTKVPIT